MKMFYWIEDNILMSIGEYFYLVIMQNIVKMLGYEPENTDDLFMNYKENPLELVKDLLKDVVIKTPQDLYYYLNP